MYNIFFTSFILLIIPINSYANNNTIFNCEACSLDYVFAKQCVSNKVPTDKWCNNSEQHYITDPILVCCANDYDECCAFKPVNTIMGIIFLFLCSATLYGTGYGVYKSYRYCKKSAMVNNDTQNQKYNSIEINNLSENSNIQQG